MILSGKVNQSYPIKLEPVRKSQLICLAWVGWSGSLSNKKMLDTDISAGYGWRELRKRLRQSLATLCNRGGSHK